MAFGVYPKGRKRAGIVFRKKSDILYRITTVERADLYVTDMYQYSKNLNKDRAEAEFLLELHSPRNKSHALEIALMQDTVEMRIFEMIEGAAKFRFNWTGTEDELKSALRSFGVMMIALRF